MIDFYNKAAADLPDHTKLKGMKLPGASVVLDRKGERFAEVFEENQRRVWVALADIPEHVQKAFIAAEDKRFYQHKGIDERGLIRAFIGNLASSGRPQGGSTITQQIVKNLLVGEDLTYERKIREMIVASRVEHTLSKAEILELYLNSVYLGRGSWGIELAARSYFGKPAKELTLEEGALLAGLTKGPNYFNPDRHPGRAQERLAYVLSRLQEDGALAAEPAGRGLPRAAERSCAYERPRRDIGFHFVDQVAREAKSVAGIEAITANSYTVRSTISPQLQRAVEEALAGGAFALRAQRRPRPVPRAPRRISAKPFNASKPTRSPATSGRPGSGRSRMRGCRSTTCTGRRRSCWRSRPARRARAWRVGLTDGRILPLSVDNAAAQRKLTLYDVVLVRVADGKGKSAARAELRVRPLVQGTVVVLENKTGRILAMTGGFSYPLSQLNRATQAVRQPGSAIKPLSYLAALGKGLQPNTLVSDEPITLPPIGGGRAREQDYWTPKNYDGGSGGTLTLRRALENSRNLATVHLLDGGIESTPEASLDRLCDLAVEAQIYRECVRYYPFVLGAQPVRPIDLAAFYAAIANEGLRPAPHVIDSIERNGVGDLSPRSEIVGHDLFGRPRRLLSAQDHAAGRAGAGHGARDRRPCPLCRRQDRHLRRRERRLVRRLHQRRHRRGLDRLRQRRRQAPHARRRLDRRPRRGADLRAGDPGGVGQCRARKPRSPRRRPRPNASSRANRSISSSAKCRAAAERRSPNASASIATARSSILNISWSRAEDAYGERDARGYLQRGAQSLRLRRHRAARRVLLLRQQRPLCSGSAGSVAAAKAIYYGQYGPYGRDPRYQAAPPRDPYGREYQTPQRIDPGYIWGNRRSY